MTAPSPAPADRRASRARGARDARPLCRLAAAVAIAILAPAAAFARHPDHVSIAEAELNVAARTFEVAVRLDAAHLEEELSARAGRRISLDGAAGVDALVLAYLRERFEVRAPGRDPLPLRWIGREDAGADDWLYVEVVLPETLPTALEVRHRILLERLARQVNTITFILGETRRSLRFTREDQDWKRIEMETPVNASGRAGTYEDGVERWHARRLHRLQARDGWLTLAGLHWLTEGAHTVGRAASCRIRVDGLPVAELGTLTVRGDEVTFVPAAGVAVEGVPEDGRLHGDATGDPTVLRCGPVRLHLIDRSGRRAIRVWDEQAPARRDFAGVERYPVDPRWRIEAAFEPALPDEHVLVASVVGTADREPVAGRAVFAHDGHRARLVLQPGADAQTFFVVFGDATNGRGSYGGGRFLQAELTGDGGVILDFNRAYNPPCAFTPYATCPLPLPENRLPFAIPAGERAPRD